MLPGSDQGRIASLQLAQQPPSSDSRIASRICQLPLELLYLPLHLLRGIILLTEERFG